MTYDWDELRPQIIDLYIGRNLTLDEVAQAINTKNGLDIRYASLPNSLRVGMEADGIITAIELSGRSSKNGACERWTTEVVANRGARPFPQIQAMPTRAMQATLPYRGRLPTLPIRGKHLRLL